MRSTISASGRPALPPPHACELVVARGLLGDRLPRRAVSRDGLELLGTLELGLLEAQVGAEAGAEIGRVIAHRYPLDAESGNILRRRIPRVEAPAHTTARVRLVRV